MNPSTCQMLRVNLIPSSKTSPPYVTHTYLFIKHVFKLIDQYSYRSERHEIRRSALFITTKEAFAKQVFRTQVIAFRNFP